MSTFSLKRTFLKGIALALPVGVILYVFMRLGEAFSRVVAPMAAKLGVDHWLGELTLTVITIFLLAVMIFVLGLMMQLAIVAHFRSFVEGWILKLVPSLNYLKLITAEKLEADSASQTWKPVFIYRLGEEEGLTGFIIEENEDWITFAVASYPTSHPVDILITRKSAVKYQGITMKQMRQCNRNFGKGYLDILDLKF